MNPVVGTIWDIGIAVGPVIGYFYQFYLIRKKKSVGTFSINLCGMLLFCNIMRIGFYFFTKYAFALLVQSFLMIIAQILLLQICVKVMGQQGAFDRQEESANEIQEKGIFHNFWRWKQFSTYLLVIGFFSVAVIGLSAWFSSMDWSGIGEMIGYLSLISQSLLMAPQIMQNYKQKRVKGLSHFLVGLNFTGDLMKFGYFIVNNQPTQFFICGVIQIILDFVVIVQIVYYARKNKGKQSEAGSTQDPSKDTQKNKNEDKMDVQLNNEVEKPPCDYNELQDQNAI